MGLAAVIDLGTNTFRLLIAEINQERFTPVYSENQIVRLGEGFAQVKQFRPAAMTRGLDVLMAFHERLRPYAVSQISVIGTSAFREAQNRDAFLAAIRKLAGWDVDVISGEDEGRLTFLGANLILQHRVGPMTLIDIGGGSTEFIIAEGETLHSVISLPLGVVSLTERHRLNHAATRENVDSLRREVEEALKKIEEKLPKRAFLAGTAGTLTTLAAMDQKMTYYNSDQINGYRLSKTAIDLIWEELLKTPIEARASLPGLEKGREDLMPAGIVILRTLMDIGHSDAVTISDYGLREGVLWDRQQRGSGRFKGGPSPLR